MITLLTDFGTSDPFVGVMKGVILEINPQAQIVDLTHDVDPQDIPEAAFLLKTSYRYFPAGTIHLVVVDPGVGTERRAIALRTNQHRFVAPDNGVLSYVLSQETVEQAVALTNEEYFLPQVSRTFHGRDIFAPVAAHLSLGVSLEDLGEPISDLTQIPLPHPTIKPDTIEAQVIHIDRFGNLITNLAEKQFDEWLSTGAREQIEIETGEQTLRGISQSYADMPEGSLLAIFGSSGHLEISANQASASQLLGLGKRAKITIRRHS